jgi:hypothetical protein
MEKFLRRLLMLASVPFVFSAIEKKESFAQCTPTNLTVTWEFTTDHDGDDMGWDIVEIDEDDDPSTDDGYVVVGSAYVVGNILDAYAIRFDANGDVVWEKYFDGGMSPAQSDAAYSVIQSSTDHLVICGVMTTNTFSATMKKDMWVTQLDLDGNEEEGWPQLYGSSGNDYAWDIIEDSEGDYVLVGQAAKANNTFAGLSAEDDGDISVLKIDPDDGAVLDKALFYYGDDDDEYDGGDIGQSIIRDCDDNLVVVSFCGSCEVDNHTENYLLKLDGNLDKLDEAIVGKTTSDHGAYDIIQPFAGTYGDCESSDPYLSLGISHTSGGCLGAQHDFWVTKTNSSDLSNNTDLSNCSGDVDEGAIYGGSQGYNGFCSVQTCDGYLLAGMTESGSNDDNVSCNNDPYSPYSEDIWLVLIDPDDGSIIWDESLGDANHNGAHSIIRIADGSYLVAGYSEFLGLTNNGYGTYVVKFELNSSCATPTDLTVTTNNYCASATWTMDPCVPGYTLQYKRNCGGCPTWYTVENAVSPVTITNPGPSGNNMLVRVRANCSPNNSSAFSSNVSFQLPYCSGTINNCLCNPKEEGEETKESDVFSVEPNPSNGSFKVLLQLPITIDESCRLQVLDQKGRIIYSDDSSIENGLLQDQIALNFIPSGFYCLKITTAEGIFQTKIVIQKE